MSQSVCLCVFVWGVIFLRFEHSKHVSRVSSGVSWVSTGFLNGATRAFYWFSKSGCFKDFSWLFQRYFMGVLGHFKEILKTICFKNVSGGVRISRLFQGCFKCVLRSR